MEIDWWRKEEKEEEVIFRWIYFVYFFIYFHIKYKDKND